MSKRFQVVINIREIVPADKKGEFKNAPGTGVDLRVEENVEAPYALKALGIVLRRAMQIPLALKAAAESDDPFRSPG